MKKVGKKFPKYVITCTLQMWLNWTLKIQAQIGIKDVLSKTLLANFIFHGQEPPW
jgi:hypothetical protein